MKQRPEIWAALNHEIAYNIHTRIAETIRNLHLAQPGHPTETIGAAPPTTRTNPDQEPENNTPTERFALQPDRATRDLQALAEAQAKIYGLLVFVDRITHRWGMTPAPLIDSIFCDNCVRFGRNEPRDGEHLECKFCRGFRSEFNRTCPQEIWNARDARGGRIDRATIMRVLHNVNVSQKKSRAKT